MPRRKSGEMTQQTGANTGQRRSRKKKDPANPISDIKLEMQQSVMYDNPGMTNGMMIEECNMYPPDFYYQHGGPTSTASGSMNNGYGPSSQSQGPPGSAQPMNQSYPEAENIQPSQFLPQYNMTPGPMSSQPPPVMMPQHPGPPIHPPGPSHSNGVNPGVPQPQFMMRPMPLPFPQPPLLEYRLMEMNRRIYSFNHQEYPIQSQDKMHWWEVFGQEFFDDDARFTVIVPDTPEISRRFSLCRLFIPKFFRHLFETGITELYFAPRIMTTERTNHWGTCAIECDQVTMLTAIEKPIAARTETDAKIFIEFGPYEEIFGYRIRQFYLELKGSKEFISQQVILDPEVQEKIRQGLTRSGLTSKALMFLKLSVIMEPMQLIMHQCRTNSTVNPRDALRNVLFTGHKQQEKAQQRMLPPGIPPAPMGPPMTIPTPQTVMPPQPPVEEPKKPVRKRTRKTNNTTGNATTPAKQRKGNSRTSPAQATNNFPMNQNYSIGQYQEVLVVGEPSLMGGDFGDGDERSISRIENMQFDGSMAHGTGGIPGSAPMSIGGLPNNGSTPMYSRQNSFNRGIEVKMQPQSVPISRASSQSHLAMLQPPPPYDNSQWNVMNQSNTTLIAQPICDQ